MSSVAQLIVAAQRAPTILAAERAWERAYRADASNAIALLGYCDALIQAGRSQAAIPILTQALDSIDNLAGAYALLGEAYFAVGEPALAIEQFQLALLLDPNTPALQNNLCAACLEQGQTEAAIQAGERAVQLDPDYVEARFNLGNAYRLAGRQEEAIEQFRRAAELEPNSLEIAEALGIALRSADRILEALEAFKECVRISPRTPIPHFNLGLAYRETHQWKDAEACFARAAALKPDFTEARSFQGTAQINLRRYAEGVETFRKVLALDPDNANALTGLPMCYMGLARLDEAFPLIERAIERTGGSSEARLLMGLYLIMMSRVEEAEALTREVLRDDPTNVDAHHNLSLYLLSKGRYEEGWPENEWRLRQPWNLHIEGNAPFWDGSPMPDKTLLVVQEQAIGDTLMFARYLDMARERVGGMKVICNAAIVPVLQRMPAIDELIPYADEAPPLFAACDAQVRFPSFPYIFHTRVETIPPTPYLTADPERIAVWKERLARDNDALKVGLVWAGSPQFQADAVRSPGLAALAPLAGLRGVQFYCFQKGAGRDQMSQCPPGLEMIDLGPDLNDFGDTAAALHGIDLLISSCTSIVHLAGGLGLPVWAALCSSPDWRWMWEREDSPWYPSLRLFRQPALGDWRSVFTRMAEELPRYALSPVLNSRLTARMDCAARESRQPGKSL